jgi:steroid delta-isomerase-like uncharacterized protein
MRDNAHTVRQFIDETLNQGDVEGAARFVWEDVVEQVPFPGQGPGLACLQDVLRSMRTAFPGLHWSVEEQLADGDRDWVLTRFEWTGTHCGPFLGVPPTGRRVTVWGMVIDRFVEGRIKDTRMLIDTLGLMTQLGALPSPRG